MKIKTLLAVALMTVSGLNAMAQTDLETFQFVDKNGNAIADGSTLTISEIEDKGQGLQISTGLFVKNVKGTTQAIAMEYDIQSMPSGHYSICFPGLCESYSSTGLVSKGPFLFDPSDPEIGNPADLLAEWFPTAYGTSTMTVQIKVHEVTTKEIFGTVLPAAGDFKAYGPKVTLNLVYADPAGINGVQDNAGAKVVSRYNAAGMQINSAVKGLNIEKLSNGKTIKRIVK